MQANETVFIAGSGSMVGIKYQIVVMGILAGSTAQVTRVSVYLVKQRSFTASRIIPRFCSGSVRTEDLIRGFHKMGETGSVF